MILISDIHGCHNTLRRLLRKCPDEETIFLGDLIDRGPDSASVVRFAMEQNIPTVAGNHEDLMLFYHGRKSARYDSRGLWIANGGSTTLASFGGKVPREVLDWVKGLPLYIERPGVVLSHTGEGKTAPDRMTALWARITHCPEPDKFHVFGHTTSKFAILGEGFARIDTGAAYSMHGYGNLTALQFPQMRVFTQAYDESPL